MKKTKTLLALTIVLAAAGCGTAMAASMPAQSAPAPVQAQSQVTVTSVLANAFSAGEQYGTNVLMARPAIKTPQPGQPLTKSQQYNSFRYSIRMNARPAMMQFYQSLNMPATMSASKNLENSVAIQFYDGNDAACHSWVYN